MGSPPFKATTVLGDWSDAHLVKQGPSNSRGSYRRRCPPESCVRGLDAQAQQYLSSAQRQLKWCGGAETQLPR